MIDPKENELVQALVKASDEHRQAVNQLRLLATEPRANYPRLKERFENARLACLSAQRALDECRTSKT